MISTLRRARQLIARSIRERRLRAHHPFAPIIPLPRPAPPARQTSTRSTPFDANRAFAWLTAQCDAGPRIPGTPGHSAVRELILTEVSRHADSVATQEWRQRILRGPGAGTTLPMCNILARFNGTGAPAPARPHLMLCAHWDTRPVADRDPDPAWRALPVPGANDGASGVAILLEMARLLAAEPPPFPLLLAFWDGEDLGENCYGSRLYARQNEREAMPAWLPRRSILLDMVGKRELRCITDTASIAQAPALWDEVHEAARALGLERHFFGPAYRIGDDHIHLARAGIESIVLIDFDYPEWHTTADTADRCSPESLAVIGEVLQRFIADTAAASTSP